MENLKEISTKELIAELMRREGVEATEITPYEPFSRAYTGPCVVLVVTD